MEFDAGDGLGYRTLQFDVPINLNYADTGLKHWVFRITLANNQQLYSHSKIHFSNISNMAGSAGVAARGVIDRRRTITATEQFNGIAGVADIVISFHNANDQVIRRPLIVAEGLDPGHITKPEEPEGQNTFDGFVRSVRNSQSNDLRNLISGNPFIVGNPSDYDIIYINWRNGTDWLQRNALVLEEVIRWVNNNKGVDLNTGLPNPNVVLGSSMGGVIARMALGRMDRAGGFAAHQTNLYVSLDAPHQGANVPLGYQALARHGLRMYIATGPLALSIEGLQFITNGISPLQNLLLADQPAAKQLLSNRIDINYNPANSTHQTFMQDLATNWAYPVNIRNIAISNGSECAIDQEFTAGSTLIYHYRSTKTRFIGDLISMLAGAGLAAINVNPVFTIPLIVPGTNKFELTLDIKSLANGGGNQVYYGNIKITKKVLWLVPVSINLANKTYNAPTGLLPLDSYPGSLYPVSLANQPGSASQDWMFSYDNTFFIQRRFAFIHTTSALDIGLGNTTLTNNDYLASYIGGIPPITPLNSPFDNFSTAFNFNPITISGRDPNTNQIIYQFTSTGSEPHEGLYLRTANWLAAELNGNNAVRTNCIAFCSNGTIVGNSPICSTETFTAPFGNDATYTWTLSPPNSATITTNGNTINITKISTVSGFATLSVDITGACGNRTLSRAIAIGGPYTGFTISGYPYADQSCYEVESINSFQATLAYGESGTGYQWGHRVLGVTGDIMYPYNSPYFTLIPDQPGTYEIFVRPTNACGAGTPESVKTITVAYSCLGGRSMFTASPNPTTGDVLIESIDKKTNIKQIDITDKLGNLKKRIMVGLDSKKSKISIAELPADIYIIRIFDGKNWVSKKVVKN